jgi:SAM-dependent methyltransferase
MGPLISSTVDVLGCAACPADRLPFIVSDGTVRCPTCNVSWPVGPHGAVNAIDKPAKSVLHEIDGMRSEHPGQYPTLDSFFFQQVEQVSKFEDRVRGIEGEPKNYYHSTELNFRYAFDKLGIIGSERVLEVGAEHDYPFLRAFRDRGCECFATNLFFCYEPSQAPCAQVVLGDMNNLPYRNAVFDVVLLSATSHHSPDLPGLLAELSRVTRPGAWVLLLNDPTDGLFKHALDRIGMGAKKGGERHALVNENEYPVSAYRRLARATGFDVVESFFSVYYDQKLRSGDVAGVRFSLLARLASLAWRIGPLRTLLKKVALYPGQMIIGLELNLILRKRLT